MFTLHVEVDGQRELDLAFNRAADAIENCEKYWPKVADVFYEIEKEQFATEGGRSGTPWAKLSPAYAEWKARYLARETFDARNKILELSGALKSSLTSRDAVTVGEFSGESRGGNSIYIVEPLSLTLGSSLPYALAHQRGNPGTHLPERPPIQLRAEDARRLRSAFKDEVEVEVERAGWPQDEFSMRDFFQASSVGGDDFAGLEWVDDL